MVTSFWPVLLALGFAIAFSGGILYLAHKIEPKVRKRSDANPDTFECGVPYLGDARGVFNVKFYLVAVLFILFDIEALFLFPWALSFKSYQSAGLGWFIFAEMVVFLFVLLLGYVYIRRKGALEWEDPN